MTHIPAFFNFDKEGDPVFFLPGVLHPDDGIGAIREWCAGHDPRGLSRFDSLRRDRSGGDDLDHIEKNGFFRRCAMGIHRAKGISVHRRVVFRRDRAPGVNILADHPSEGVENVHFFQPQRGDGFQYFFQGFVDADHDSYRLSFRMKRRYPIRSFLSTEKRKERGGKWSATGSEGFVR